MAEAGGSPNATPRPDHSSMEETMKVPEIRLPDSVDQSDLDEALQDSMVLPDPVMAVSEKPSADLKLGGGSSGADLLLPIMIYAIVKSNPNKLVSHLLYAQRYRAAMATTGEAQYAVVNTTAAVEFLENVDLAELGLSSAEKVLSVTDLEPIGLTHYYHDKDVDTASIVSASSRLRGRVSQVGEMAGSAAGSANKVLTGVVDSSWTALRGLMVPNLGLKPVEEDEQTQGQGNTGTLRPRLNPRRASAFTLASVTATVANIANATTQRQRAKTISVAPVAEDRELHPVSSRPPSIRESSETSDSEPHSDRGETTDDEDTEGADDAVQKALGRNKQASDVRSIKSVSSMLSKPDADKNERLSIHERFANMGLHRHADGSVSSTVEGGKTITLNKGRAGQPVRRTTLLNPMETDVHTESPPYYPTSELSHYTAEDLAPPIEQFMEGNVADLRISDVGALLRDYRRLGDIVRRLKDDLEKQGTT